VGFDYFRFGVFVFDMFVLGVSVFSVLDHYVFGITKSCGVFGAFVRSVGFEFGAIRGAMFFDFLGFSLGELGLGGSLVFGGVQVRFFLAFLFFGFFVGEFCCASGVNFLGFVLFEVGATGEGIHLGVIGSFFVLGLGQFERERRRLLIAQFDFGARGRGV
jgi:hypothetical protein